MPVAGPGFGYNNDYYNPYTGKVQKTGNIGPFTSYTNKNVLGLTTGRAPSTSNNPPTTGLGTATDLVKGQQEAGNSQIDADYDMAMNALNDQEGGLNRQAGQGISQIDTDYGEAKNELTNNRTTQQGAVNTSLQQGETQGATAMTQARDLFRQTQQSNIAQLSALGISSSSVQEALAERLGVETARRIGGISGNLQEIRTNASNELNRIGQYYDGKLETARKQADVLKGNIQTALIDGLNRINSARQQASSDKARGRQQLLSEAQNQIFQLQQQQQKFEQSMQQWREQKAAALTPIAQDPNYVQNLLAQTQQINQQYAPTGFTATPSFNVDEKGNYSGQINWQKNKDEDPMAELYRQAGITQ
jgi:hypothetical protein